FLLRGYPTQKMFSTLPIATSNFKFASVPSGCMLTSILIAISPLSLRRRLDSASSPSLAIAWQTNTPTSGSKCASISDTFTAATGEEQHQLVVTSLEYIPV